MQAPSEGDGALRKSKLSNPGGADASGHLWDL